MVVPKFSFDENKIWALSVVDLLRKCRLFYPGALCSGLLRPGGHPESQLCLVTAHERGLFGNESDLEAEKG